MKMNAIIVPNITDFNKGDQALVWESWRLIKDTGLYNNIFILTSEEVDQSNKISVGQSKDRNDFKFIPEILKHPRRNKHKTEEHVADSKFETFRMIKNASLDFLRTNKLLNICTDLNKVKREFDEDVYRTVQAFHEADAIYVKGGGFIHAYGEMTAPYLMWYFLFYIRLAKALKKKIIILPNSFGPFEGLTVKKQVRSVLSKVDLIYAREHVSSESLSKLLDKEIPVEMDLGFFLKKDDSLKAEDLLKKYNLNETSKIIGITIRPWRFPGLQNPETLYHKYLKSVADLISHMILKGFKIALCNQSIGPNAHEDDRNAIKDLLNIISNEKIIWIDEDLTCSELKALYSKFYFFIGTRFHSIIFSLTSIIPSIAIGYGGNKAKGIMGEFNLNENVIPIHEVTSSKLIKMFDNAIKSYYKIQSNLTESLTKIDESRGRIIEDIKRLYES